MSNFAPISSSVVKLLRGAVAGLVVCAAGGASAAVITTNESALDTIFSQTSFGTKSIDIRFNTSQTIYNTALLSIDTAEEWNELALFEGNSVHPTINMFFVDGMTWCGGPVSSTIGCASNPGNMLMLDSDWASTANGAALAAHELAHNLGLDHIIASGTNLMNPVLSGNTTLTAAQTLEILGDGTLNNRGSNLIQFSGSKRYITITPILVAASISPVPEPETWAMMVAGLLGMAGWVRRRKTLAA